MKTKIDLEELAKNYATKLHKGQFRRDGKTPYIKHPREVVKKLKKLELKYQKKIEIEILLVKFLNISKIIQHFI